MSPTSKPCGSTIANMFPKGGAREVGNILWDSMKMGVATCCLYELGFISVLFCGRLGKEQLDGVSLASSTINMVGLSIASGTAAAFDTFFAQCFGSSKKKQLSVYLQIGILIVIGQSLVSVGFFINSYNILVHLGQSPRVARVAEEYLLYFSPGMPMASVFFILSRYLQVQGKITSGLFIEIVCFILNIVLQYVFIVVLGKGVWASGMVHAINFTAMTILMMLYIAFTGVYKATWSAWSLDCLEGWGKVYRLICSGIILVSVEWMSAETGLILMGMLGVVPLGAAGIHWNVEGILYSCALGTATTWSHVIGRSLGAGDSDSTRRYVNSALMFSGVLSLLLSGFWLAIKDVIPFLFTDDRDVQKLTTELIPWVALFAFVDLAKAQLSGIFRGCGRHFLAACISIVLYSMLGFAISVPLMFCTWMGPFGYWIGLDIGSALALAVFVIILLRLDWHKEVIQAMDRLCRKIEKLEQDLSESKRLLENSKMPHRNVGWLITKRLMYFVPILTFLTLSFVFRVVYPPYTDVIFPSNSTDFSNTDEMFPRNATHFTYS